MHWGLPSRFDLLNRYQRPQTGARQRIRFFWVEVQAELDLVGRVAGALVPESLEWFIKLVRAQCLHLVAQWQAFLGPVRPLSICLHCECSFGAYTRWLWCHCILWV